MRNSTSIATNDVFRHVILLLGIHRDRQYLADIFARAGLEVSKSQISSWQRPTGKYHGNFRPMPETALRAFLVQLAKERAEDD